MQYRNQYSLGFVLTIFLAGTLYAQEAFVYPSKGQSEKQMEKDKYECYSWAKQQSGFDPMNPPSQQELEANAWQNLQSQQQTQDGDGSEVGEGVVKGAVGGAIVGEVVSDEPAAGAVIGGLIGGIHGSQKEEQKRQEQERQRQQAIRQQAQVELKRLRDTYNRAYAACLEGRGYTVK
jgi:hypothetical protein